ncbi:MAG: glutaminyl-peptide cyclotransferase [Acidobacteria bacterium]|nr:glutaminyl-peptide cyclotransferase [Acidobacteriota bacterium]
MRFSLLILLALMAVSCGDVPKNSSPNTSVNKNANTKTEVPTYTYQVVKSYPHDPNAFTQGLIFRDGFLYEGTGEEGESTLRKVDIATGKVLQKFALRSEIFGEGLTAIGDKLYQISWQNGLAWEYNLSDFKMLREITYTGEGWGITTDGTQLIMSDGTHLLKFIDPQTFKTTRTVPVMQDSGKPLYLLNELEWVKGEIWANIWHSEQTATGTTQGRMPNIARPNTIARIDPASGHVTGWIDLAGISPTDQDDKDKQENTLNGIAYDEAGDRLFVTGKNWKKLYEIKVVPK